MSKPQRKPWRTKEKWEQAEVRAFWRRANRRFNGEVQKTVRLANQRLQREERGGCEPLYFNSAEYREFNAMVVRLKRVLQARNMKDTTLEVLRRYCERINQKQSGRLPDIEKG